MDWIDDGRWLFEARARNEYVQQSGLSRSAESATLRARLGWESAPIDGVSALIEGGGVMHADEHAYNVSVPGGASLNGRVAYPSVNDPSAVYLNRAQLTWTPDPRVQITAGRQQIAFGDQRFVGYSTWRQTELRFDAARINLHSGRLAATYAYVWRVDRAYGGPLDFGADTHLFDVTWDAARALRLEVFAHAMAFSNLTPHALVDARQSSNLTWGGRAAGSLALTGVDWTYEGAWARQSDYRGRTAAFRLDYWQAALAAGAGPLSLRGEYARLGGDGARGFITPIATTHAQQGWADAFSAVSGNKTHVDGLQDANLTLTVQPNWRWRSVSRPAAVLAVHDFWSVKGGAYLAHELDAQLQAGLGPRTTLSVALADYERARAAPAGVTGAPASRTKAWVTLDYRL